MQCGGDICADSGALAAEHKMTSNIYDLSVEVKKRRCPK